MRRSDVVEAARGWLDTPYHHQASRRGVGCDCLGLVRGVWRELLGEEPELAPPYSQDWAEAHGTETLLEAAGRHFVPIEGVRPGALMLFRWKAGTPAKHAAIAIDGTRLIHAYDAAGRVTEGALRPWRRRLVATFDFPEVTD